MENPKAFISYSWTSQSHADWVLSLATQLRESGVDIILDKWDLKEGHDAVVFMEKMVADPEIKKVIIILDSGYLERANSRKGGVGTETQIISAEVYKKVDQSKFVAVVSERDAEGNPYLPIYYKSRIYIDLSNEGSYGKNFDQLLRWLFDKPLHLKPDLGKSPTFLNDNVIASIGTATRARRAIDLLKASTPAARGALDDYLSALSEGIERFRISSDSRNETFDDDVVASIDSFLPFRNEFIEVLDVLVRYWPFDATSELLKFLERVAICTFRPPTMRSWSEWDFDNLRFIVHELFLYTVSSLIKAERFDVVAALLDAGYYLGEAAENRNRPLEGFGIFHQKLRSLEHRNQRLKLNRFSVHADLLEKRSHAQGFPFRQIMQSDFVLYLRSSTAAALQAQTAQPWWPETLVYAAFRFSGAFEIFARSQSSAYFDRIRPMLIVDSVEEFREVVSRLVSQGMYIPRWQFDTLDVAGLSNLANLATRP